jgi:hypothetical protein
LTNEKQKSPPGPIIIVDKWKNKNPTTWANHFLVDQGKTITTLANHFIVDQ